MSYIALMRFADLRDGNRIYEAGDTYPRPGFDVPSERLAELAGSDNRTGHPLIAVQGAESPVEAVEAERREIPAETVKPARKPRRSRKKE